MPTMDEKKTQLEAAYKRREKLENQCGHLEEIVKQIRDANNSAEDYSVEYGEDEVNDEDRSPPLRLFLKLDDLLFETRKEFKTLGEVFDTHDQATADLEAEEGVICRCCGEVRCEDPERAKKAPTMTLELLCTKEREGILAGHGPVNIYLATLSCGIEQISVEGMNGTTNQAAEEFWVKHGFDKHGAYHYTNGLERRLKKALAAAPDA